MKISLLGFIIANLSVTPLTFMNRLSVSSANFENTENGVLGHANSGKSQYLNFNL